MKIGVDAGCLGITDKRLQVGVYQVVKNLLTELEKRDKKNQYVLYSFHPIEKKLLREFGPRMKNIVVTPSRGWLSIWLPLQLLKDKPDVFLALNQSAPFRLPTQNYKTLGLFYDIAYEKYPELYSYAASVKKHSNNSKYLASKADKIIAISQSTKSDLQKLYKVPAKKIEVAYPGISSLPITKKYTSKNPYFLFVGAFKKSKNVPTLLRAFKKFCEQTKNTYSLFLAGGDKWPDEEIATTYTQLPKAIQKKIKFFSFVNQKILSSLFRSAGAFVSPSLYEGFGLPFIEAQKLGCPVIGTTRGSLPEILGESALLIDPENDRELSDAMIAVSSNITLRKRLIQKGKENAEKYSWKDFAKKIQSAIDHL